MLSALRFMRRLAGSVLVLGASATLTCALATPRPPALSDAAMAERTQACTACHGPQGKAGPDGYYPRLAGKPAEYLYRQLVNFRDGRRHYAPMTHLIDTLDDAYLREMAQYFSKLSVPYPAPKRADLAPQDAARAQTLVVQGDAARGVAACQDCHGKALTGVQPSVPGLLGLPADYLTAQLGGWQSGQRRAHGPDCMAGVAKKLSANDASVVARWLAAQPVPVVSAPAERAKTDAGGTYDRLCLNAVSAVSAQSTSTAPALASPASSAPAAKAAEPSRLPEPAAPRSAQSADAERGAYLARIGNCAQCHTARGGAPYAGGRGIATPFGVVMAGNLTPDLQYGLGSWSADDFWQALHHGISKDGRALYPAFPYTNTTHVTRADANALFAYLQTLPASATPNLPHKLRWPFSTQWALKVWRLAFFRPAPEGDVPTKAPDPSLPPEWQWGAYLVRGLAHCDACHAPRNFLGAQQADDDGTGAVMPGSQWFAPSLSRIRHTQAELQRFLQTGVSPWGTAAGPMAEVVLHSTQYLTDADARAMALYLHHRAQNSAHKSAAPVAAPALATATSSSSSRSGTPSGTQGAQIYEKHCADCHGKTGLGVAGAYPALAGNPGVTQANTNNLVLTVLHGGYAPATAGNPRPHGMPPFLLRLNDAEIAAVLTTIRSQWGNRAAAVSEFDINKLRRAQTP